MVATMVFAILSPMLEIQVLDTKGKYTSEEDSEDNGHGNRKS